MDIDHQLRRPSSRAARKPDGFERKVDGVVSSCRQHLLKISVDPLRDRTRFGETQPYSEMLSGNIVFNDSATESGDTRCRVFRVRIGGINYTTGKLNPPTVVSGDFKSGAKVCAARNGLANTPGRSPPLGLHS
jgi:hypothetical protein